MPEIEEVKNVKTKHEVSILGKQNVVGVGIGYKTVAGLKTGELCMVIMVRQKVTRAGLRQEALVPARVDGLPTDVVQVGEIWAQQSRTGKYRPAPGGVSIGHYRISAGTLGAVVRDRDSGERLILSNNHVLANSNDAQKGDPILQPGGADGGTVDADTIARLERFCAIDFSQQDSSCGWASAFAHMGNALAALLGSDHRIRALRLNAQATNAVDAAVARPIRDADVLEEILEIGTVSGALEAELGMPVRKSGRTTGLTTGEITIVDATVNVNYGSGRTATFVNQLVAGPMSQGGDSGSLVLAADSQQAVGLLFAGSSQSTIFNPIWAVLDCLNVEI